MTKNIKERFAKVIARRMAALTSMYVKFLYRILTRSYLEKCRFTIKREGEIIFDGNFNQLQDYLEERGAYFHEF